MSQMFPRKQDAASSSPGHLSLPLEWWVIQEELNYSFLVASYQLVSHVYEPILTKMPSLRIPTYCLRQKLEEEKQYLYGTGP